jgi:sec-independent protein translocase protein TatB
VQAFIFDVGWGELVLIGIVALIVIGPKELPAVLRTVGQAMTKIRRMAAEFQSQFQEAMREAEMAELKQQFDTIQDAAKDIRSFDPVSTVRDQIESAAADKPPDTGAPGPAATPPVPQSAPAEPAAAEPAPPTQSALAGPEPPRPAPASAADPAMATGSGQPEPGKGQQG